MLPASHWPPGAGTTQFGAAAQRGLWGWAAPRPHFERREAAAGLDYPGPPAHLELWTDPASRVGSGAYPQRLLPDPRWLPPDSLSRRRCV